MGLSGSQNTPTQVKLPLASSLGWLVLQVMRLAARMPWPLAYRLAGLMRWLIFRLAAYRKEVVRHNLLRALPECDEASRRRIQRAFERHFGELLLETLKGFAIRTADLQARFRIRGMQQVERYLAKGQSALVMGGHYGNWEWLAHALALAARPYPVWAVYKPLSSKVMDQILQKARTHLGLRLCPQHMVPRMLRRMRHEPGIALFIADQTPLDLQHAHWIRFLDQETPFFHGVDKIARTTGMPVFYASVQKHDMGRYEATLEILAYPRRPLPEGVVTLAFARRLEAQIRRQPPYWLWTHRRWKRSHLKPAHAMEITDFGPGT